MHKLTKSIYTMTKIKNTVKENIGNKITVTVYLSRNRVLKREGIISQTYPSCFLVQLDEAEHAKSMGRLTCGYQDILTGDVKIAINQKTLIVS